MRFIVAIVLGVFSTDLFAGAGSTSDPFMPTTEQIATAKAAYAKFGGKYRYWPNAQEAEDVSWPDAEVKMTYHYFCLEDATDTVLKGLPHLPFYFGLLLSETKITDAGLKELRHLNNLSVLVINHVNVTDAGLKEIKEIKNLTVLSLIDTNVSDDGLTELYELKTLRILCLGKTKVTACGVKKLREALPKCEISR